MSGWRQRVEQLCYDGEAVLETVEFGASAAVVTSHRVLVFTPETDGANFEQVERPNVDGVSTGAQANTTLVVRSLKYGLVGVILLVAGQLIALDDLVGSADLSGTSAGAGLGGMTESLQGVLSLLAQLDRLLQIFGVLAVALSVVFLAVYWYTRESTVVISVAGGDDIHIPQTGSDDAATGRLQEAIAPDADGSRTQS